MKNSILHWKGKSRLNGRKIFSTVTGLHGSPNVKTGNMLQIYYLTDNRLDPIRNYQNRADSAICGNCPMHKKCYVQLKNAPLAIWRAFMRGNITPPTKPLKDIVKNRAVRFGAYGDPASAPIHLVKQLAKHCKRWTGYTHQWLDRKNKNYSRFLMASVENVAGKSLANRLGWRTFRVIPENYTAEDIQKDEIICPFYTHGTKCEDCGLCNGKTGTSDTRKNIVIPLHGRSAKKTK